MITIGLAMCPGLGIALRTMISGKGEGGKGRRGEAITQKLQAGLPALQNAVLSWVVVGYSAIIISTLWVFLATINLAGVA